MRTLGLIGMGILLTLIQGNLYRLFGPINRLLSSLTGVGEINGTPSLVLPLVIYLGVHELSMPRGALIAFLLGYLIDVFSGAPLGLFAFVLVSVWWLSRIAGVRLTAQTKLTQMTLAFVFALIEAGIVLMLLAIFGADAHRPVELVGIAVPHALATAVFAPFVFGLAQRIHGGAGGGAAGESNDVTILVQRSDVGEFRRRYSWMVLVVLLTFGLLVGRLVQLQLIEHDLHHAQALRNIIRERTLATSRGVIRDSQGRVLAGNRPSYNVYVVPSIIDMEKTWPRVVELMGLEEGDEKELRERIVKLSNGSRRDQQTLLKVDVDRDAVAALETHERDLNGVEVAPVPVRYYPYGELAAHILGYMREVDPDTLARLDGRGYRAGDRLGAVGVERRWESYLIGQRGWKKVLGGRRAKLNREDLEDQYLDEPRRLDPVPGRDISLTLDIELMQSVERAMRGQVAGAVVVVDVRTGRILAALSKPSYDPNILSGSSGKQAVRDAFRKLYSDPLKPTLDKTVSAAYPPGSTFKPFAALAGLADHVITPRSVVDCRGGYEYGRRYFRCTGVHRNVRLHEAIVRSCNTYFYSLGEGIHIDRLSAMGMDFGFGVKTGIGINPEARGRMPTRAWYTRRYRGAFRGGFTLLSAIGQGASTVSVLQLTLGYAALANGGTLYQPQVVRSIETSDGTIVQEFPPRVRRLVEVDPENLALVKSGLVGVVAEREGTAHKARIPGVDMAGKTGTAQVSRRTPKDVDPHKVWYFNRDHAWFAGYAPAHSPEIAIVVLVEHGGAGGKAAVPVAMQVVRDWQKLREKRLSERSTAKRDRGVP